MDKFTPPEVHTSTSGPLFKNPERAAYEISHLLRTMPESIPPRDQLTEDQVHRAKALQRHAESASYKLVHGIEAIGNLLFVAANSPDDLIDSATLVDLGVLLAHTAVEIQAMDELEDACRYALSTQSQRGEGGACPLRRRVGGRPSTCRRPAPDL